MILVTGAYGFIGSCFVKFLNSQNIYDIDVSDYLDNGRQFANLKNCKFNSFVYPDNICTKKYSQIFHFGAISNTTCWDGALVMRRNYQFTKNLIDSCIKNNVQLSYSSSASVYGNGNGPLNLYAYSKYLIDEYVKTLDTNLIQGFRYFNVYSTDDSEWHKGDQASPFYKFKKQAQERGTIEIFEGSEEIYRDFVDVNYVCGIQWRMCKNKVSGVFDLGTGVPQSFYGVAHSIANQYNAEVKVVPFPETLKGSYQFFTKANMDYAGHLNASTLAAVVDNVDDVVA